MLRAVQAHAEGVRLQHGEPVPAPDLSIPAKAWIHTDQSVPPAPYVAAAERIAEGWLDVFALRGVDLGSPPRWNRDPRTGIEAPLEHGKCLDYADPDHAGAGLCADRGAQVLPGHRRAPRQLVPRLPVSAGCQLGERLRGRHAPDQLGGGVAAARRLRLSGLPGGALSGIPRPLAALGLPAPVLRARLAVAALGRRPPRRRGGGAVRRRAHLAALAAVAALARRRQGAPRARGAGADRRRRREPRAGARQPAARARDADPVPARGPGARPEILRCLRNAHRGDAGFPRLDHGRRRQRADVRRCG